MCVKNKASLRLMVLVLGTTKLGAAEGWPQSITELLCGVLGGVLNLSYKYMVSVWDAL